MTQETALIPTVQLPSEVNLVHSAPVYQQLGDNTADYLAARVLKELTAQKKALRAEEQSLSAAHNSLFAQIKDACRVYGEKLAKKNRPEVNRLLSALKGFGIPSKAVVTYVGAEIAPQYPARDIISLNVTVNRARYDVNGSSGDIRIVHVIKVRPPAPVFEQLSELADLDKKRSAVVQDLSKVEQGLAKIHEQEIMIKGAVAAANLDRTEGGKAFLDKASAVVSKWLADEVGIPKYLGMGK